MLEIVKKIELLVLYCNTLNNLTVQINEQCWIELLVLNNNIWPPVCKKFTYIHLLRQMHNHLTVCKQMTDVDLNDWLGGLFCFMAYQPFSGHLTSNWISKNASLVICLQIVKH